MSASSPCIGICTLDVAGALCLGCGRTLAEIAGWGAMSEAARGALRGKLPGRLRGGPALDGGPGDPQVTEASEGPEPWTGAS